MDKFKQPLPFTGTQSEYDRVMGPEYARRKANELQTIALCSAAGAAIGFLLTKKLSGALIGAAAGAATPTAVGAARFVFFYKP